MLTIIEDKPKLVLGAEKWQAAPFRFLDNLQVFNDSVSPSWQDIVLSGNTAVTLTNAKANGLNYLKLFGGTTQNGTPTPTTPVDIVCNNGVVKYNRNLYWTEYHGYHLSQSDGVTVSANGAVNVSGMVDCRTIKSFKITTTSPQGSFRIFKYGADNTFIDATSTGNMDDIVTLGDNVGFFRIQYNFTSGGTNTENILIYDSAYSLNGIYVDGTQETVEIVTGKNLFDQAIFNTDVGTTITYEWLQIPNGTYTMSTNFPPKTSSQYTNVWILSGKQTGGADSIANGVSLGYPKTITVTDGWYTVAYRSTVGDIQRNPKDYNWQVEEGSTATAYEPYTVLGTATAENLFKVGDYKDVQEVLTGSVTRNIGIKVLDGTEAWTISGAGTAQDPKRFAVSELIAFPDSNTIECLSTHYPFSGVASTGAGITSGTFNIGIYNNIHYIRFAPTDIATVTDWTDYLKAQYNAGTPVIIVYPLATPTVETVEPQHLGIRAGTNIVEIAEASIDNLELEVSYKATI